MNAYRYVAGQGPQRARVRVGNILAGFMVGLALLFDLVQFFFSFFHAIPLIGNGIAVIVAWYVAVLALIIFGLWFSLLGVNYFSGKQSGLKLVAAFGTFVVELIPILDALPAITAGVVTMIIASRIEDMVGNEEHVSKLSGQGRASAAASVLRGRRVAEMRASSEDNEGLESKANELSAVSRGMNLERRRSEQYGIRSASGGAAYENYSDKKGQVLDLTRGKNLRREDALAREENTQEEKRMAA